LRTIERHPFNDNRLRSHKQEVLDFLDSSIPSLYNLRVLEVGCFIGDLLSYLRDDRSCQVSGIESSQLAVEYALTSFNLPLEHNHFLASSLCTDDTHQYDLIILDDILGWLDHSCILQHLALVDKVLAPEGYIYIRDYVPPSSFKVRNHHVHESDIFSYKMQGGHKTFFLNTGFYLPIKEAVRNSDSYQRSPSSNPVNSLWSDTLLQKTTSSTWPTSGL